MADLVIGHFQDLAAAVLMAHIMAEREGVPLPILEQVRPPLVAELRPPVLSNNWGNLTEMCMLDDTFKALVRPLVVSRCRSALKQHRRDFAVSLASVTRPRRVQRWGLWARSSPLLLVYSQPSADRGALLMRRDLTG